MTSEVYKSLDHKMWLICKYPAPEGFLPSLIHRRSSSRRQKTSKPAGHLFGIFDVTLAQLQMCTLGTAPALLDN